MNIYLITNDKLFF